jgi:20S proteasome alpha/beta subunit
MYTGAMKILKQKLFPVTFSEREHLVFALSGNEAYGKMAIDDCIEVVRQLEPEKRTLRNVNTAIRSAIKPINDQYVYSRPAYEREALEFQFVIGAWLPKGGGAQLFSTEGSAVNLQSDYECIGSGAYLGHYLIRPVFHRILGLNAIVLLATQMLAAAKTYDVYCGGPSTFSIITNDGEIKTLFDYPFYQVETFLSNYDYQTRSLLFQLADSGVDDDSFNRIFEIFTQQMKHLRETWKTVRTFTSEVFGH